METVPTYRSLLVHYEPEVIGYKAITEKFKSLMGTLDNIEIPPPTVVEIPVLYGGEMGPDIGKCSSPTTTRRWRRSSGSTRPRSI